jgi:hypothetical protein
MGWCDVCVPPRFPQNDAAVPAAPERAYVAATVRVNAYAVIERAIEEGIERGWHRAHKHTDDPVPGAIRSELYNAVLGELCEVLRFHEEG